MEMETSTSDELTQMPDVGSGADGFARKSIGRDGGVHDDSSVMIRVGQSGNWMDAQELRAQFLGYMEHNAVLTAEQCALSGDAGIVVDMRDLNHLDGSALQVLIAADRALRNRGEQLRLQNCSESLQRWFAYAGAPELVGGDGQAGSSQTRY